MANVNLSWDNPAADAGGTPTEYFVYRASGNVPPSYNSDNTDLSSSWTSLSQSNSGNVIPVPHTTAGANTTVTDLNATAGTQYTYAIVASNAAGKGLPASPSSVPHAVVTA